MGKWIFLMIGIVNSVLASESEGVTIQVISAVQEKSITNEFDERLKNTGLEVHKKIEEGRYVVTLGRYENEKSAQQALKKSRKLVTKGAFIRSVIPVPIAKTELSHDSHPISTVIIKTPEHDTPSAKVHIVEENASVQVTPTTAPSSLPKREMRRNEISDAIDFYKTSPYYRFESVTLRQ